MIRINNFELVYISIREESTRKESSKSIKTEVGEITSFTKEVNDYPKFLFENRFENKPKLLVKTFEDEKNVNDLVLLKKLIDVGEHRFRFSPFVNAAPIGYGTFSKSDKQKLRLSQDNQIHFLVYVYRDGSKSLQEFLQNDDLDEILQDTIKFDYAERTGISYILFSLFKLLENIQTKYETCGQYQIIHYDIKPSNYILDQNGRIYIVDLDSSGLYDVAGSKYIFEPRCNLLNLGTSRFLPYEIMVSKSGAMSILDKEKWHMRHRYSEIWLAWSLIYQVLTGIKNPFFFLASTNRLKASKFIKDNQIQDLFSKDTIAKGDYLKGYAEENDQKQLQAYIDTIGKHLTRAVSPYYQKMMNTVFIEGLDEFDARPSFHAFSKEFGIKDVL